MFVNLKTAAHVSILVPFLIILMEYHDWYHGLFVLQNWCTNHRAANHSYSHNSWYGIFSTNPSAHIKLGDTKHGCGRQPHTETTAVYF